MIAEPLFLVGSERSGTTLLRLMLDHHPSIRFHHEYELCVEKVGDDGTFPAMPEFVDWLGTIRGFEGYGLEIDGDLSYPELVDSFLEQLQAPSGKPRVISSATSWTEF